MSSYIAAIVLLASGLGLLVWSWLRLDDFIIRSKNLDRVSRLEAFWHITFLSFSAFLAMWGLLGGLILHLQPEGFLSFAALALSLSALFALATGVGLTMWKYQFRYMLRWIRKRKGLSTTP